MKRIDLFAVISIRYDYVARSVAFKAGYITVVMFHIAYLCFYFLANFAGQAVVAVLVLTIDFRIAKRTKAVVIRIVIVIVG